MKTVNVVIVRAGTKSRQSVPVSIPMDATPSYAIGAAVHALYGARAFFSGDNNGGSRYFGQIFKRGKRDPAAAFSLTPRSL